MTSAARSRDIGAADRRLRITRRQHCGDIAVAGMTIKTTRGLPVVLHRLRMEATAVTRVRFGVKKSTAQIWKSLSSAMTTRTLESGGRRFGRRV